MQHQRLIFLKLKKLVKSEWRGIMKKSCNFYANFSIALHLAYPNNRDTYHKENKMDWINYNIYLLIVFINSMFWHHSFTCPHILNYCPTVFSFEFNHSHLSFIFIHSSILSISYVVIKLLYLINQRKLCLVGKIEEVVRMEWNQITIVLKTNLNMWKDIYLFYQ